MDMPVHSHGLSLADIGARIRAAADELEKSGTEFAAEAGVPYSTYRAYTSGQRAPSAEFLSAVFMRFGILPSWVLTGQGPRRTTAASFQQPANESTFVVIPRYDVAASAGPGAHNSEEAAIGGLSFSKKWLQSRGLNPLNLKVIDVVGESMASKLDEGDKVLVDVSDTIPKSGRAYVLRQGGELLVKYCQLLPDGILRVSSENQNYPTYDIDLSKTDDVSIVGRVRASTHEW
ncbi:XRE family transcriptional regulator [Variovorax paradoxus]|uniref:Putative HTH-type transcriptional regulator n=1 Tax=Variovorax paradoxus TaxID=34073 RepID=A0A0H2MCK7_VARPD|nr:S24 family peptidase [Variovorax paradoxus]KLN54705.1 putative HTH-type transcriptional regulator [Variovorax paradoxus]